MFTLTQWMGRLVLFVAGGVAAAQVPDIPAPPSADPLRFSSLPLNTAESLTPPSGRWLVSVTGSYFNVWELTWHTGKIHEEWGLLGSSLTQRQVDYIAEAFPQDQFYHVDIEGSRTDVTIAYGLPRGLAVVVQVPWIRVGSPNWDGIPESFHRRVGLERVRREHFPRGETTVVLAGHQGVISHLDSRQAGGGLGDAIVSISGPAGRWLGAEHRWVVSVEAPTGDRHTLRGSGGWDVGVRWFATWGGERQQTRFGLGYSYLDPEGSWLGITRNDTWHTQLEVRRPLYRTLDWRLSVRFESSPVASFTSSVIGDPSFFWRIGVIAPIGPAAFLALDLGQNFPDSFIGLSSLAPDFTFHVTLGSWL